MKKSLKNNIDEFLADTQYARGFSEHTTISYKNDLNQFMNFGIRYFSKQINNVSSLDREMIIHFLDHQFELGRRPKTVSRRLCLLYTSDAADE